MNDLEQWLKDQLEKSEDWFPDDWSIREGYQIALQEVLEHIKEPVT